MTKLAKDRLEEVARRQTGLQLFVLHGSRARGEAIPSSDWDFGYIADRSFDPLQMISDLADVLATERIDLADLGRANGLLRFRVARDGILLFERQAGDFDRFRVEAVQFWCDAGPIIEQSYDAVLARLRT